MVAIRFSLKVNVPFSNSPQLMYGCLNRWPQNRCMYYNLDGIISRHISSYFMTRGNGVDVGNTWMHLIGYVVTHISP